MRGWPVTNRAVAQQTLKLKPETLREAGRTGVVGAVLAEHEADRRGLMPLHYLWLRWGFTVVAVAMMVTVLTLRLLGQTLIF